MKAAIDYCSLVMPISFISCSWITRLLAVFTVWNCHITEIITSLNIFEQVIIQLVSIRIVILLIQIISSILTHILPYFTSVALFFKIISSVSSITQTTITNNNIITPELVGIITNNYDSVLCKLQKSIWDYIWCRHHCRIYYKDCQFIMAKITIKTKMLLMLFCSVPKIV